MGKYRTRLRELTRSLGREQIMILAAAAVLALVYTLSGKAGSPLSGNILPRAGFGEAESEYSLLVDGLPFSEEYMAMDQIMETDFGGDFLRQKTTRTYCRQAWEPNCSDWNSSDVWEKKGCQESTEKAHAIVQKILAEAPESILEEGQQQEMEQYIASLGEEE